MPLPIRSIEYQQPNLNELQQYIADRFIEQLPQSVPPNMIDVYVQPRDGYFAVKVFITSSQVLAAAEVLAADLQETLRSRGYNTLFYVQTWSGTGFLPSD